MAEWIINGRFTFDGHALIDAESEEEAREKFEHGDFDFDDATASLCDWERRGKPELQK